MRYASLPTTQLLAWALLNNVELHGIKVEPNIVNKDGHEKGGGLISSTSHNEGEALLTVPRDVTISAEQIKECARTDAGLRELFSVLDGSDLTKTTRGVFLVFLLYQFTIASADSDIGGVQVSFTDYVKFLPKHIPLPTFYTEEERAILEGTSLSDALGQKNQGLQREFALLEERTKGLTWARTAWWGLVTDADEDGGREVSATSLQLEDWKLMDAIYRSRALELPNDKSIVMVPVLDMANHASDDQYNARFEADADGNVILVVRDGKTVGVGDEISIMYGCGGACEMIFSYGFLDQNANNARELFLSLNIPSDDPLRLPKSTFSKVAPGVRIFVDQTGRIGWESEIVWWACVNEEDGLEFRVLQSIDGQKELTAVWKGEEFEAAQLKELLSKDELRDVFVLRSLVLLQQRVEQQGGQMSDSEAMMDQAKHATSVKKSTWELINRLRDLEVGLLATAFEKLEVEKAAMLDSEAVKRYLQGGVGPDGAEEHLPDEDFS